MILEYYRLVQTQCLNASESFRRWSRRHFNPEEGDLAGVRLEPGESKLFQLG